MGRAWRVGRKLGRTIYLDDRIAGMLDDERLAGAVVEGLALLETLGEGDGGDGWRRRLAVWRLRLEALRRDRSRAALQARARAARRARPLARR